MTIDELRVLAPGQIWKTKAAAIEILRLGQKYIHYKVTKLLGQKRVSAQVSGTQAMANYLRLNGARLVRSPSPGLVSEGAA
jgi:hypothetical protein